MHSTPRPEVSGGPRTHVGLWLGAMLRGDREGRDRLVHKLNRGEKGWNEDEPAVVEAICQLAVRQFFGAHLVPIDDFVADMCKKISIYRTPPRQADMEAVIRAALDDGPPAPSEVSRSELLNIRSAVTAGITDSLRLDAAAIDHLVAEAESVAMMRGYSPPLSVES